MLGTQIVCIEFTCPVSMSTVGGNLYYFALSNAESSYEATGILNSVSFAEVRKVFRNWTIDNKLIQ
jgi:hypothetical protein